MVNEKEKSSNIKWHRTTVWLVCACCHISITTFCTYYYYFCLSRVSGIFAFVISFEDGIYEYSRHSYFHEKNMMEPKYAVVNDDRNIYSKNVI